MAKQRYDQQIHPTQESDALLAAMQQEGCPVCQVVHEAIEQAMNTWQYEGFTDVEQRHYLIRIRGFCPLHTWQLAQHNAPLQLALVYEGILSDLLATIPSGADTVQGTSSRKHTNHWLRRLKRWLQPSAPKQSNQRYSHCPFCQTRTNAEQRILDTLLNMLRFEEAQTRFRDSMGLCRIHFLQAAKVADTKALPHWPTIMHYQQACLQRLHAELQEQIRKHDYLTSDEPRGDEMTAWRRAAKWNVGNPGIY
jgi:hypothetical protein